MEYAHGLVVMEGTELVFKRLWAQILARADIRRLISHVLSVVKLYFSLKKTKNKQNKKRPRIANFKQK